MSAKKSSLNARAKPTLSPEGHKLLAQIWLCLMPEARLVSGNPELRPEDLKSWNTGTKVSVEAKAGQVCLHLPKTKAYVVINKELVKNPTTFYFTSRVLTRGVIRHDYCRVSPNGRYAIAAELIPVFGKDAFLIGKDAFQDEGQAKQRALHLLNGRIKAIEKRADALKARRADIEASITRTSAGGRVPAVGKGGDPLSDQLLPDRV
jgi:hypothetical protein